MYKYVTYTVTSGNVLGMIPHKTKRGMEAMNRLKVFDGIPPPYDKVKMNVVDPFLAVYYFNKTWSTGLTFGNLYEFYKID